MSAIENLPLGEAQSQPQPKEFYIWKDEVDDVPFKHLGRKAIEHQIMVDGLHLGLLYLEEHGHLATIDGIDYREELKEVIELSDKDWSELAAHLYVHGHTRARRVEHPGGQNVFLEAV